MKLYIISLFFGFSLFAQEKTVVLDKEEVIYSFPRDTEYTTTPTSAEYLDVKQKQFKPLLDGKTSFGYNKEKNWIRFKVSNQTSIRKWVIQFDYPLLDFIEIFIERDGKIYSKKTGDTLNFNTRYLQTRLLNLELDLESQKESIVYINIQSEGAIDTGFKILTPMQASEFGRTESLAMGFYFGGLLLIAFYNLFVYFFLLDSAYLVYFLYVVTFFLFQSSLNGVLFQIALYDYPIFANKIVASSGFVTSFFISLFTYHFLKLKFSRFITIHIVLALSYQFLFSVLSFFIPYIIASKALTYNVLFNFLLYFIYGIISWKRNAEGAKYFVFGWFFFLAGAIIFALKNVAIIPSNFFSINAVQIGSLLEVLFLSLGLANKIENLRRQSDHLNKNLQSEVDLRTAQYKEEKEKAESTLLELQTTQSQLFQAERMAALGQLVGGVAHEINNPIAVIKSNAESIQNSSKAYLMDLPEFLKSLDSAEKETFFQIIDNSQKNKETLTTKLEREKKKMITKELQLYSFKSQEEMQYCLDLIVALNLKQPIEILIKQFGSEKLLHALTLAKLVTNQNKSVTGIGFAVEKASRVIFALRSYLNVDLFGERKKVTITEEIDKSLSLYDNYINGKIEIIKNYSGNFEFHCINDNLIQVWRNLIFNSIQAMYLTDKKLTIEVSRVSGVPTELIQMRSSNFGELGPSLKEENLLIHIIDSGMGIPDEQQDKIFTPFFTTKPLGEGIGLGLFVCKKIVQEHQGILFFQSNPGRTQFSILLPIAEKIV